MAFFSDQYRLDRKKPSGSRLLEYMKKAPVSFKAHQAIVLNATFFAYASFHAARKTTSVVKSALNPESSFRNDPQLHSLPTSDHISGSEAGDGGKRLGPIQWL
ncbi:hypothetical protein CDL15_Pgr021856 [Punica granatum]|uniref:Uncharacterized protein n=1 Tax=Punica granatum TaxID=22663 RepID=A0A218WU03_PUNGR|nr:hypothetical protein CDL15_Pgr021856 [Punica granatum]